MSRDIVRILESGVVGDVDGAGCDHGGGAGGPVQKRGGGDYGVSRRWVQILVARYLAEGEVAFEPRSRRPHTSPQRTSQAVEDAVVALRAFPAAILLLGTLLGVLTGGAVCARYLRQEIAANVGPRL